MLIRIVIAKIVVISVVIITVVKVLVTMTIILKIITTTIMIIILIILMGLTKVKLILIGEKIIDGYISFCKLPNDQVYLPFKGSWPLHSAIQI